MLNDARAEHGLGPLRAARKLGRAADAHTREMIERDYFDHASADGTPFDSRVRRYAPVSLVGEAIAGTPTRADAAARVVQIWMDSPPHRALILDGEFTRVGVGRRWGTLAGTGQTVVTADFAG